MAQKKWKINILPNETLISELSKAINVNTWLSCLLIQRGIDTYEKAKLFFRPSLTQLHDPFLMKDMEKAISRINEAILKNEKILIYGDYDVDGTTSVALVYGFLKQFYSNIIFYIPDRYAEGYGISTQGIDFAGNKGISLIIALDCGIKSIDKIAYANSKNIDFIICDHHNPGDKVPEAIAVLDPKQKDCKYPYKELSGCGVGFKLLQAYCISNNIDPQLLFERIDLLVVSIGADIVPITGENRVLAYYGLKKLNSNPLPGLQCLMGVSGFTKDLSISNVVFGLAPRINAAGRIAHAHAAVELLLSDSVENAIPFGKILQEHNSSRKDLDSSILQEALEIIHSNPNSANLKSTVLFNKNWHKGVIGIVASKCIEQFYRPTIILTESNGYATGSARSVDGFDVYEAICQSSELLTQFGGHTHAAGLTMPIENIEKFVEKFEWIVSQSITEEQLIPKINIDLEVPLTFITQKTYNIIKQMAPFGPGNMTPVLVTRNVVDTGNARIVGEKHLKLEITDVDKSIRIDAIAFDQGYQLENIKNTPFDICYIIEENTFNGKTSLQLQIRDINIK
ncbi:MAG: single-stranded-DNA-specific exonuclease RecJ [Bacteroidota bacterium]|nr:single-stranded-DNA-specific exonuclease RecJ [Bacteroidota bacterium]